MLLLMLIMSLKILILRMLRLYSEELKDTNLRVIFKKQSQILRLYPKLSQKMPNARKIWSSSKLNWETKNKKIKTNQLSKKLMSNPPQLLIYAHQKRKKRLLQKRPLLKRQRLPRVLTKKPLPRPLQWQPKKLMNLLFRVFQKRQLAWKKIISNWRAILKMFINIWSKFLLKPSRICIRSLRLKPEFSLGILELCVNMVLMIRKAPFM